jgi:tetratricopeptide (TPR) repeat protein
VLPHRSLVSKGDFDTAYAAARQVAATPVPKDRAASPGARLLLWEAKTLPARILLHRDLPGNALEALASLPKPAEMREFQGKSLAYWWIDGLRFTLEAKRRIDEKNFKTAREVINAMSQHGALFSKTQSTANAIGERALWTRAFRALEVLASDIRGHLAVAGPKESTGTAYNWFASAADRQHPATMMFPPVILTPLAIRLGEYYLAAGQPAEAIETYQRALAAFPNDMNALLGLKRPISPRKPRRPRIKSGNCARNSNSRAGHRTMGLAMPRRDDPSSDGFQQEAAPRPPTPLLQHHGPRHIQQHRPARRPPVPGRHPHDHRADAARRPHPRRDGLQRP